MDPSEIEFLCDNDPVFMVPNFTEGSLFLIQGDVGPFRAGQAVQVRIEEDFVAVFERFWDGFYAVRCSFCSFRLVVRTFSVFFFRFFAALYEFLRHPLQFLLVFGPCFCFLVRFFRFFAVFFKK